MKKRKLPRRARNRVILIIVVILFAVIAMGVYHYQNKTFESLEKRYDGYIFSAGKTHRIDPLLIKAVIYQESRFDALAVGGKGDTGLMQVIRRFAATDWARYNKQSVPSQMKLFDPALNIEVGSWYLGHLIRRYKPSPIAEVKALCAYNAGHSVAQQWFKDYGSDSDVLSLIGYPSTRRYVEKITERYEYYQKKANRPYIHNILPPEKTGAL